VTDDPATRRRDRCHEERLRGAAWHLFNVDQDPGESTDLKDAQPAVMDALYADYLEWRAEVSRLPFEVAQVVGEADVTGRDLALAGGHVRLADNTLYDFHDGNFSFTALVEPQALGPGSQSIAARQGSWSLSLTADGRVELAVIDHRTRQAATLSSPQPLPGGEATRVSFSIFTWTRSPAAVRLFVGDRLVDQDTESVNAVRSTAAPVLLGGGAEDPRASFRGRLGEVELRVSSLMLDEVRRLEGHPVGSLR
jgi:hypothetical protein